MVVNSRIKQSLGDKYFIKRIGGTGGDNISIQDGKLYLDDIGRDEVTVFRKNNNKEENYRGYNAQGLLCEGANFVVPNDHFFALGDNSFNSYDSRYFGPVTKNAVVGRPIFIYYPFTKRWGLPK